MTRRKDRFNPQQARFHIRPPVGLQVDIDGLKSCWQGDTTALWHPCPGPICPLAASALYS